MQLDLPTPSADAQAHSEALRARVAETIVASDGWLSFADYMNLVLYTPGLGYYSAGARKFGAAGDFVTAPEISALFSQCLAGQCAQMLAALGGGSIIEPGAGTGIMAADILLELERLDALPEHYLILEPSADLQARQAETFARKIPHLRTRVQWLDRSPQQPLRGVLLANEVLDALPVSRFTMRAGEPHELGVSCAGDNFVYVTRPASTELSNAVAAITASTGAESAGRDLALNYVCSYRRGCERRRNGWERNGTGIRLRIFAQGVLPARAQLRYAALLLSPSCP